jgi:hypothetical protein
MKKLILPIIISSILVIVGIAESVMPSISSWTPSIILFSIAFLGFVFVGLYWWKHRREWEEKRQQLIPKLQVKPIDIEDGIDVTYMVFDMLNYSAYTAKNIVVDVKLEDKLWKRELEIAVHKDDKIFEINDEQTKERLEKFFKRPTWDELKPGKAVKLHIGEVNKDFELTQQFYFTSANGRTTPIAPEETSVFKMSQGWKEQIDSTENGKPIKILIHTSWKNEIGKVFDQIIEYQLICTKIGTGRSYTFLPTGNEIRDQ